MAPFWVVDLNGVVQEGHSKFICVRMPRKGSHDTVRPGNTKRVKAHKDDYLMAAVVVYYSIGYIWF